MTSATFEEDLAFMRSHGPVEVLSARGPGAGQIAVSARWQGRVMTSAVDPGRPSLGFVNRAFIEAGQTGTSFDNYGGEDRFWLGPEGGQHGLYFPAHAPFELDTWQVPRALQEEAWAIAHASATSITLTRTMRLVNRSGTEFHVAVERDVNLLGEDDVSARFGVAPPSTAEWVAFETVNRVTNVGAAAWTRSGGLLSVWILGQFPASADSVVIVPFVASAAPDPPDRSAIVHDGYFGAVPPDRLVVRPREGHLLFKVDGEHRSKIGVGPARARPIVGSYRREAALLTLVHYDLPAGPRDYVNSMWEVQRDPYDGDVVHSYNDGPIGAGRPALGSFYEIETSSPAADLAPGQSITHAHATLHLAAAPEALEPVALHALGTSLASLRL
jgi:hypothetical protein